MKGKVLRNVALGVGCLMVALTLSSNVIINKANSHVIKSMEEMPGFGMVQINGHAIKPMEEMPGFGMVQINKQVIKPMQDMLGLGMNKSNSHVIHLNEDSPIVG